MTEFKFIPKEFEAEIKASVEGLEELKPEGKSLTMAFLEVINLSEIAYQLRRIADKLK